MTRNTLPILVIVSIILPVSAAQASSIGATPHRSRQTGMGSSSGSLFDFNSAFILIPASPDNWRGGAGNWSNGADWTAGEPGTSSDVIINTGNDNVTLDTSVNINSLTLGGASGHSTLASDGLPFHSITLAGALTVNPSGTLSLGPQSSLLAIGNSSNAGMISLILTDIQINGAFTNSGNIQLDTPSSVNASGAFVNSGTIGNPSGSAGSLSTGNNLTNSGTIFLNFVDAQNVTNQRGGTLIASSLNVSGNLLNSGDVEPLTRGSDFFVGGTLINSGTFSIEYSQATVDGFQNSGSFDAGGILNILGDAGNTGSLEIGFLDTSEEESINVSGTLSNGGSGEITLEGPDVGLQAARVVNNGVISVDRASVLAVSGDLTNAGRISTGSSAGNGRLQVGGTLTLTPTGAMFIAGDGDMVSAGRISNAGTIVVGNRTTLSINPGPSVSGNALPSFVNSGSLTIAHGGTVIVPLVFTQTAGVTVLDGILRSTGSGTVNFAGGSVFGNQGSLQVVNISSNAAINIGDALMTVGELTFGGNFTQGSNGSLTFDIAGASPGQYDQFNVGGHAQLAGTLTVDLLHSYVPQIGNTFDIMNFPGSSGTFGTVVGLPINGQEHFVLEYNSTNLTLDVVAGQLAGSSSLNGGSLGGGSLSANPFIEDVSGGGNSLLASTRYPGSPTPEPGSILLFASGVVGLAAAIKRKRF